MYPISKLLSRRSVQVLSNSVRRSHHTVESRPYVFKWGVIPVTLIWVPCIYVGAMAAKRGAAFLEEWNIFVPEDDED